MKRLLSACMILIMLCTLTVSGQAHNRSGHDCFLEEILFGNDNYASFKTEKVQRALRALEYASYLAVDQFNGNGSSELAFLRNDYKVPGLPRSIDSFNFGESHRHRNYTHRGWNYTYTIDKANWEVRKNILLATTEKVFDFRFLSGSVFGFNIGYGKRCESFAALIYYIHVLGDHEARQSFVSTDVMIPFAQVHVSDTNPDTISELMYHLSVLFKSQKDTYKYKAMMQELQSIGEAARSLAATAGGVNNNEKFLVFKDQVNNLLTVLQDYVPRLLKEEAFFTKVFP